MTGRATLTRLAKMVCADQGRGRLAPKTEHAIKPLAATPDHVFDLVDLMAEEGARKRPDSDLICAYALLLVHGLELLRYDVERHLPATVALVGRLRAHLLARGAKGRIDSATLLTVLQQFAAAKLDMGDELRELMQRLIAEEAELRGDADDDDDVVASQLAGIVRELGDDPFTVLAQFADNAEAMPADVRVEFAMVTLADKEPAVREVALGFLANGSSLVRMKLAEALTLAAPRGLVSPTMLRRMIAMRNWLPEAERPALDGAIEACRASGVACAPWPKADAGKVLASGIDGAGAQTVIVVLPAGNKRTVAGVLLKQGVGVRDIWVHRRMRKPEYTHLLQHLQDQVTVGPSSMAYVGDAVRGFLAANLQSGVMPPFGLLGFAETIGLTDLNPDTTPLDQRIAALCASIDPTQLTEAAVRATLDASIFWPDQHDILNTWFDDDVLGHRNAPLDTQVDVLLAGPLQARRRRWAEQVAWTASTLQSEPGNTDWQDFAIVARELAGKRPLHEIGLMEVIAHTSIEVMGMERLLGARHAA